MWVGSDDALRAHLEALAVELGQLADRLARPAPLKESAGDPVAERSPYLQSRVVGAPSARGAPVSLEALHRLAVVAEDQGWLDAGEAILLRKLAFRVAFYLRRRGSILP